MMIEMISFLWKGSTKFAGTLSRRS